MNADYSEQIRLATFNQSRATVGGKVAEFKMPAAKVTVPASLPNNPPADAGADHPNTESQEQTA